jgi:hypothetical protein
MNLLKSEQTLLRSLLSLTEVSIPKKVEAALIISTLKTLFAGDEFEDEAITRSFKYG